MNVTVIEILPSHSVVEFEVAGYIQRRVIAQGLYNLSMKGPASIPDEIVMMGMEYSNVDLAAILGEELPPIRVRDLQDKLRRAGLWTQQDYETKSGAVVGVWQKTRGVDVTTILNAALRGVK